MAIDVLATAPHYVDHLVPVWDALPAAARGRFFMGPKAWRDGVPGAATLDRLPGRPADRRTPLLVVAHGDLKIARVAGRRRLALGQHGAGQSYGTEHPSYPGGRDQDDVELFLVPNDHAADRTRTRYPGATVAIVGCPKLDRLPRKPQRSARPVIAVSFHFDTGVAPETRSAWQLYRAHVAALARTYRVLGHAHPRMAGQLGSYYRSNRIEVVASLEDVFRRADVYVCDNSSSMFEFAATGRGVVVLNAPWFRPRARHGLRFWDAAGVGVNVHRPRDLQAAIELALEDPPAVRAARKAALDLVYQPRRGGARLAARALLAWAGGDATLTNRTLVAASAAA